MTCRYRKVSDRLGRASGDWTFYCCGQCGSVQLHPLPQRSELASFYPEHYALSPPLGSDAHRSSDRPTGWYARRFAALEYCCFFGPMYRRQVRRILRHTQAASENARLDLLDVGCGNGYRLREFQRLGHNVQGVDFQLHVVEAVRQRWGIVAKCGDVLELDAIFPPASFDLVTAFYVLEHVPDVERLTRGCFHVLRPGGWLVAAVPLQDSVQAALFGASWSQVTEAPRHISLPSRSAIVELWKRVGLEDTRVVADWCGGTAAMAGLSLVPRAAASYAATGGLRNVLARAAGAMAALAWLPLAFLENHVLRRPAAALVFGRRPAVLPTQPRRLRLVQRRSNQAPAP